MGVIIPPLFQKSNDFVYKNTIMHIFFHFAQKCLHASVEKNILFLCIISLIVFYPEKPVDISNSECYYILA